jgi:hypothetical protein
MVDARSRGVLATRDVPPQNPLLPTSDDASPPTREGERLDANPARARADPIPRAPRSPQRRRRSARLTSPKPSVSRESDPLHLLADAVDLERGDGDEALDAAAAAAAAALARRVEITRAAILEEVAWIHQTRRARDELARVRDETRARVSVHADRAALDPALDSAPAVGGGGGGRGAATRGGGPIERDSERAVEDRRRQRHVDARLTRLEDAVAALTRKRALEDKAAAAARTAAAAAAFPSAPRSHPRGFVAGLAGMGVGGAFGPLGFDPRTPSASAFAPSRPTPGLSVPRAFAAAAAGAELGAVAARKPPQPQQPPPPMGSLS